MFTLLDLLDLFKKDRSDCAIRYVVTLLVLVMLLYDILLERLGHACCG